MPALTVENLSKAYRRKAALRDVSFSVEPGELFCLSGPDGAGKTTLVRILAGTLKPDSGRISILGLDGLARPEELRRSIGYMPQRFAIYADLTAEENLEFYCAFYGLSPQHARGRVEALLRLTRLDSFRRFRAGNLSGGMKQKLVLGCALVHEPQVLLLDEPTTGIDPLSRREFWGILNEFLAQGRTIIYSSVYLEEALRANRIALMNPVVGRRASDIPRRSAGTIAACDSPERLLAGAKGRKREVRMGDGEFSKAERAADALGSSGAVVSVQRAGARIEVLLADAPDAPDRLQRELAAAGVAAGLVEARATLEDVFVLLSDRDAEDGE